MTPRIAKLATATATALLFCVSSCSSTSETAKARKAPAAPSAPSFSTAVTSRFLPAQPNVALKHSSGVVGKDKHGYPTYDEARRHRYVRTTAYSHMENEPGAPSNFNAAGTRLKYTSSVRSAAADWSVYPVGTKFRVKGLPYTYVVDDLRLGSRRHEHHRHLPSQPPPDAQVGHPSRRDPGHPVGILGSAARSSSRAAAATPTAAACMPA